MKTKTQKQISSNNSSDLHNRNHHPQQDQPGQPAAQPAAPARKPDARLPIDSALRQANRSMTTNQVLEHLRTEALDVFRMAEVVGKWVWVHFDTSPAAQVRQHLAQLGFHWNGNRQAWQHPCGAFSLGSKADPRETYATSYPGEAAS